MEAARVVVCDSCSSPALVPPNVFGSQCPTNGCISVLLKPAEPSKRYVRIMCNGKQCYQYVDLSTKIVQCANCKEEFEIGPIIVETRCRQNVYGTWSKKSLEEQIQQLKSELSAKEETAEKLRMENSALCVRNDTLELELQRTVEVNSTRQKEIDLLCLEYKQLTENLNQRKKENENSKEEINELRKKAVFDDREKKELSLEWLKAEDKLAEMKKQRDELAAEFNEYKEEYEIMKEEWNKMKVKEELKNQEKKKVARVEIMRNMLETIEEEMDELTNKVDLEQSADLYDHSVKEDEECKLVSVDYPSLKAIGDRLVENSKEITEILKCQKDDINLLVHDNMKNMEKLTDMTERHKNITEERDMLKAKLDNYESKNDTEKNAAEQVDKLVTTNMNLSEAVATLTKLVQNPVDLKKAEDEVIELKQKMKEMEEKHNEKIKKLEGLLQEMFGEFHSHLDLVDKKELQKNEQTEAKIEKPTALDELVRRLGLGNNLASMARNFASHEKNDDLSNEVVDSLDDEKDDELEKELEKKEQFGGQFELEKDEEYGYFERCLSPIAFTPPKSPAFNVHDYRDILKCYASAEKEIEALEMEKLLQNVDMTNTDDWIVQQMVKKIEEEAKKNLLNMSLD